MERGASIHGGKKGNVGQFEDETGRLHVGLIGGLSLSKDGRSIQLASRKARALIGYLALASGRNISREQLVGLLWSETTEDRARASLRQAVRALRSAFESNSFGGLTFGRSDLTIEPSTYDVDIDVMLEELRAGRVHDALLENERIADALLAGYDDIDPSFRNWLLVQRENLSQRLIRGLNTIIEGAATTDEATGKKAAEALIHLDPTNETACRHLIRLAGRKGDTATALAVYNRLWTLLDDEFDSEPSQRTIDLIASVKLGELEVVNNGGSSGVVVAETAPTERNAATGVRKLALQIGDINLDRVAEDRQHICIGFRSELIAMLVRFREWTIVDDKNSENFPQPIFASTLNYQLTGRFVQQDERLFLFCHLKDCATAAMVWSEQFELGLDSYFVAKQEVVRKVTFSLNVHISQERLQQVSGQPDVSLYIYDRWLRGQAYFLKWSPESRVRATKIFNSIIDDAPDFARAYSSLVALLNSNHFVFPGIYRTRETAQRSLELARKAVDLDPLDSRSQLHLGWAQAMSGDFDIAPLAFKLACELNEHDPWTVASAAGGFAFSGLAETGLKWSEKALELAITPVPMVWAYTSCVRYINADYEGCLLAAAQSEGEVLIMHAWRIACLWKLGRHEEALDHCERFFETTQQKWFGDVPATHEAIIHWAVTCFPIRSRTVIDDFRANLEAPAKKLAAQRRASDSQPRAAGR